MKGTSLVTSLERRQVMTFALHQSLKILQLSDLELAEWVQEEIEKNPLLEELPRSTRDELPPFDIAAKPTLREHLLAQAREAMMDIPIAEFLIGHLDERGYLSFSMNDLPCPEETVLKALAVFQSFDPPGIGARNLQESLLLQLQRKSYSLAEVLVRDYFQDLLHSRFRAIQKQLLLSSKDLSHALNQISKLRMGPLEGFDRDSPPSWTVDLVIQQKEGAWDVQVGNGAVARFRINENYAELQKHYSGEEKELIKSWHTSGKWLLRSIFRRRDMLLTIGRLLLKKRLSYFETGASLKPIRIQELAHILNVHPTTAWRAVSNKMLSTPFGTVPLSRFFAETTSRDPIKDLLLQLVKQEDKESPYTDEKLSQTLQENGFPCARRTVSKYRKQLKIGSAAQRRAMA